MPIEEEVKMKEKRIITKNDFWSILEAVSKFNKFEEELTVCEIYQIIGMTGIDKEIVLDYIFNNYKVDFND